MLRGLLLVCLVLAQPACRSPSGVRLLDDASGLPLRDVAVLLFIDDGVRCITEPCPTAAREWRGRTDATGHVTFPVLAAGETATLNVADRAPLELEGTRRTLRLAGPAAPPPFRQKLALRIAFEDDARVLRLRVENPGPDPLRIVNPVPGRLAHHGNWGGWSLLLGDDRGPFPAGGVAGRVLTGAENRRARVVGGPVADRAGPRRRLATCRSIAAGKGPRKNNYPFLTADASRLALLLLLEVTGLHRRRRA